MLCQELKLCNKINDLAKRGAFGTPSTSRGELTYDMEIFPENHCDTLFGNNDLALMILPFGHDAYLLLP